MAIPEKDAFGAEYNATMGEEAHVLNNPFPQIANTVNAAAGAPVSDPQGRIPADTMVWQGLIGVTRDGVFGPATSAATKVWQAKNGITPDGVVGPLTWKAMGVVEPNMSILSYKGTAKPKKPTQAGLGTPAAAAPIVPVVPKKKTILEMAQAGWPWILGLGIGGAILHQIFKKKTK